MNFLLKSNPTYLNFIFNYSEFTEPQLPLSTEGLGYLKINNLAYLIMPFADLKNTKTDLENTKTDLENTKVALEEEKRRNEQLVVKLKALGLNLDDL